MNLKKGRYRIKQEIAEKGFFCDITLNVVTNLDQNENFIVEFTECNANVIAPFKYAIEMGVVFFYYNNPSKEKINTLHVKVEEISLMTVDSTFTIVLFSTIKALSNALNINLDFPRINNKTGVIEFEK